MPPDPRLNCAAEICCIPPAPVAGEAAAPLNNEAHRARVAILEDLGVPDELAHRVSKNMVEKGLVFLTAQLATAIREIAFPVALALVFLLTGCSTVRTALPGGATVRDAEWSGVKSAQPVSIIGTIDPRVAAAAVLLEAFGQGDPLGVLLPVTPIGETLPRWILCEGELAAKCKAIPLQAKVHFAGQALGPGILWRPVRLTADDFND